MLTAIVLVGGKNSIVSELYPEFHPTLIPIKGHPFLYWLTLWLKSQGFNHIVFSAGYQAEKLSAWVNNMTEILPTLCFDVVTESRPLGTGGASALCAKRHPSSICAIVNGDSILTANIRPHIDTLQNQSHVDGIICGISVPNAGRYGSLETDHDDRLLAFKEKQPSVGMINAGIYLLRSELFDELNNDKEYSLEYDCFPHWLGEGKHIRVAKETDATFIDIGAPDTLKKAQQQLVEPHSLFPL